MYESGDFLYRLKMLLVDEMGKYNEAYAILPANDSSDANRLRREKLEGETG